MVRFATTLILITSTLFFATTPTVSAAGAPALGSNHGHAHARSHEHGGSSFNHQAARRHTHPGKYNPARAVDAKREAAAAEAFVPVIKKSLEAEGEGVPRRSRRKVLRRAAVDTLDKLYRQKKRGDGQGGKVCVIKNSDGSNSTTTWVQTVATATSTGSARAASTQVSSIISSVASSSTIASASAASTSAVPSSSAPSTSAAPAPTTSSTSSSADAYSTLDTNGAYLSISIGLGGGSSSTSTSTSAPAATSSTASTSSGSLMPNSNKAGVAGGDSLPWIASELGWWYDWSATPSNLAAGSAVAVPMIWGEGSADSTDAARLAAFGAMTTIPTYIIGYEEPDCAAGSGSAGFGVASGIALWNQYVAPWGAKGSLLLSPSMCKQAAESGWLGPFAAGISRPWDITNLHINKNSMDGVRADLDHYWNTYGKPMWVTEFACVNDVNGFTPCTDQGEINSFISQIVKLFEADSRVYGYAYSDGYGLGSVWPTVSNGTLSASGKAYLSALQAR